MKVDWKLAALAAFLFMQKKPAKAAASPQVVIQKGGNQMTLDQLRELALSVGFPDPDTAAAVAMAESGGFEAAVGDQGNSFGLWQIHKPSHPKYEASLLLTPWYNGQAALEISQVGKNWEPWTQFRNGTYKKYMPAAQPVAAITQGEPPAQLQERPIDTVAEVVEDVEENTEVDFDA